MAIYNNAAGPDEVLLKRFREPAWNNPVVRFWYADLIPRQDGVYTTESLLVRMVQALRTAKRPIPMYLALALAEYAPKQPESAVFAMHCYWEGEARLGALDGVLGTKIGDWKGKEVVEVRFDAAVIPYAKLVEAAKQLDCVHALITRTNAQQEIAAKLVGTLAQRSDEPIDARTQQQYHLHHAPRYYHLPLTALQATRANAALAKQQSPDVFLSSQQLQWKSRLEKRLKQDPGLIKQLRPDRTPSGIITYAEAFGRVVRE